MRIAGFAVFALAGFAGCRCPVQRLDKPPHQVYFFTQGYDSPCLAWHPNGTAVMGTDQLIKGERLSITCDGLIKERTGQ